MPRKHVDLFAGEPITMEQEREAETVENHLSEYMKVKEVAGLLRVDPGTVRGWCHRGLLHRYGGRRTWRVRRAEVLALFAGMSATPNPIRKLAMELLQKAGE